MTLLVFAAACAAGPVLHFLYEPLGRPRWLAPLLPVSESPWEHYKLVFWPLCAALAFMAARTGAGWRQWAVAACGACAHGFATMFGIFYFYVAALGVGRPLLAADIGSFYVTMGCGFALGLRLLARPAGVWTLPALALLALTAALLGRFSFSPPRAPLFRDGRAR